MDSIQNEYLSFLTKAQAYTHLSGKSPILVTGDGSAEGRAKIRLWALELGDAKKSGSVKEMSSTIVCLVLKKKRPSF